MKGRGSGLGHRRWSFTRGRSRRARPSNPAAVVSAGQAPAQELLGLLGALAALFLGPAEELREVAVAVPLGILDVGLQAQGVAQTRLGKLDQVVVLVLGAGDLTGFRARHRALSFSDRWPAGSPRQQPSHSSPTGRAPRPIGSIW